MVADTVCFNDSRGKRVTRRLVVRMQHGAEPDAPVLSYAHSLSCLLPPRTHCEKYGVTSGAYPFHGSYERNDVTMSTSERKLPVQPSVSNRDVTRDDSFSNSRRFSFNEMNEIIRINETIIRDDSYLEFFQFVYLLTINETINFIRLGLG